MQGRKPLLNKIKMFRWAAWAGVVALTSGSVQAQTCRSDTVFLKGEWGQARFSVEIADDPAKRAQGLMHRESLASAAGMLFVYQRPQALSFWMRNTLIELDMLFIDASGTVRHIHHRAQPLDETPVPGGAGLTSVLEINGGMAKRMGIEVGSVLRHPSFLTGPAEWPC